MAPKELVDERDVLNSLFGRGICEFHEMVEDHDEGEVVTGDLA